MRRAQSILLFGEDALLLFALLWGSLTSFLSAFGLEVSLPVLTAALALLALAGTGLCRLRPPWSPLLPLALIFPWVWGVWLWWERLLPAWAAVQCAVVNAYAELFPGIGAIMPVMELTPTQWTRVLTLGVLVFGILLTLLLSLTALFARSFWGTLVLTLSLLLPGLVITRPPGLLPLLVLLWAWAVLLLTSLPPKRGSQAGRVRLNALVMPAAAALLALCAALLPWQSYQFPLWALNARQELFSSASSLSLRLGLDELAGSLLGSGAFTAAGSSAQVDLGGEALSYDGHTVLRVESQWSGHIYLRGHSAAVYTDNQWLPLDERAYEGLLGDDGALLAGAEAGVSPLGLAAQAARGSYYAFTVENVSAPGGCVYYPYQLLTRPSEIQGAAFQNDSYLARGRLVDALSQSLPARRPGAGEPAASEGAAWEAEDAYRSFVYDHYLQLPDGYEESLGDHLYGVYSKTPTPCPWL